MGLYFSFVVNMGFQIKKFLILSNHFQNLEPKIVLKLSSIKSPNPNMYIKNALGPGSTRFWKCKISTT